MREVIRRNWRFWVALAEILVLTVVFAHFVEQRDERTRQSVCAILDRIPERIDSGMDKSRMLDHCGRPHPPTVFFGHPFPTPRPTVTVTPTPRPATAPAAPSTPAGGTTPTPAPDPSPSRTAPPQPTPRPTPSRSRSPSPGPTPTPTPTPTCHRVVVATVCT